MRNVFVSYSHRLDQDVVDEFRRKFGNDKMVFSDCSLENKDLSHLSDDTINNNYIRPQLRLSSVTIVLIGAETGGRWWVDWEIYFSLRKSAGNERNGILGILIPNKQHYIPQRILDNPDNSEIITMPKSAKELEDAQHLAEKIQSVSLTIAVKTGEEGKLFGSVSSLDLWKRYADEGINLDKNCIRLPHPIKTLGQHHFQIRLHKDVHLDLSVEVVSENPIA